MPHGQQQQKCSSKKSTVDVARGTSGCAPDCHQTKWLRPPWPAAQAAASIMGRSTSGCPTTVNIAAAEADASMWLVAQVAAPTMASSRSGSMNGSVRVASGRSRSVHHVRQHKWQRPPWLRTKRAASTMAGSTSGSAHHGQQQKWLRPPWPAAEGQQHEWQRPHRHWWASSRNSCAHHG